MQSFFSQVRIRQLAGFLSLVYMGGLYWLSDQPGVHAIPPFPGADKVVHFVLYFGLGVLLHMGIQKVRITGSIGITYGIFDEVHQFFVPGRSCDPLDMLADGFGVLGGLWITQRILRG